MSPELALVRVNINRSFVRRTAMERPAKEGNSPVNENGFVLYSLFLSTAQVGVWVGSEEN